MDFSDLFSGDTWDALSPIIQGAGAVLGGIEGTRNASNLRNQTAQAQQSLDQLYAPSSPYAQQLRQELERRDAAAGRRSQYGPRETELAAKLTQARSGQLLNPQYQNLLRGANTSPYGPLAGALGYLTQQNQQKKPSLVNTASNLNSLRKGYNTLNSLFGAADTGTAADLGGAGAAFGNTLAESGAYAPDVFSTGGGIFGSPTELSLSPFSATNTADPLGSFASSIGNSGYLGLGGAGEFGGAASALSGMGTGSLAGTVGGADTLGAMFGGTGFLPGYTSTAGASGLFGGAGSAGAAGSAGGAGSTGIGGAAGFGLPAMTALPFLAALYGFGTGIFGKGDNGTPQTQSQEAAAAALMNNPNLYQQNPGLFDTAGFSQNMSKDQADQYQQQIRNAGGSTSGSLLSSMFGSPDEQ